jgi:hypothetical protein
MPAIRIAPAPSHTDSSDATEPGVRDAGSTSASVIHFGNSSRNQNNPLIEERQRVERLVASFRPWQSREKHMGSSDKADENEGPIQLINKS